MIEIFAAAPPPEPWLFTFFEHAPLWMRMAVTFAAGVIVGRGLTAWFMRMDLPEGIWTPSEEGSPQLVARDRATLAVELVTGALFAGLVYFVIDLRCQSTPEEGSGFYIHWRLLFQFALLTFLMAATVVDLELYLIPDAITVTGAVVGVVMATAVGHLQLIPLWVDWNQAIPGLAGPYIPAWMPAHPHLHALAWSLTGLVVGPGMTWLVRFVASWLMGQEALGFGDVTLMGMIGSYVGWQAIVFVFALAPLCGIVVGLTVRMLTGRTYVPYGPYLSLSAVIVLFCWKWLWTPTRAIFGDIVTLAILGGTSLVALVLLLGLSRLYWMIPIDRSRRERPLEPDPQSLDELSDTDELPADNASENELQPAEESNEDERLSADE